LILLSPIKICARMTSVSLSKAKDRFLLASGGIASDSEFVSKILLRWLADGCESAPRSLAFS
jgi:hypothetical protein